MNADGHEDQRKLAQRTIELGKPQVVADRQADAAARRVEGDRGGSGLDRPAFVVAFVVALECEQVNLVVARDPDTVGSVDEACAAHASRVAARNRHGPADQEDAVLARHA